MTPDTNNWQSQATLPFTKFSEFSLNDEGSYIALALCKDGSKKLFSLIADLDFTNPLELAHLSIMGNFYTQDDLNISKILKITNALAINDRFIQMPNPTLTDQTWIEPGHFLTDIQKLGWAWVLMHKMNNEFYEDGSGKLLDAGNGTDEYAVMLAQVRTGYHNIEEENDKPMLSYAMDIVVSNEMYQQEYVEVDSDSNMKFGRIVALKLIDEAQL